MQHLWLSFGLKGPKTLTGRFRARRRGNSTIVAAAASSKGRKLTEDAVRLMGLADTRSFPVRVFEPLVARDHSQEQGTETMCAVVNSIANVSHAGVDALDKANATCWQVTWIRVGEPAPGTRIRTNDGKRLCFPVTVRDCAWTLTFYIQKFAALALS